MTASTNEIKTGFHGQMRPKVAEPKVVMAQQIRMWQRSSCTQNQTNHPHRQLSRCASGSADGYAAHCTLTSEISRKRKKARKGGILPTSGRGSIDISCQLLASKVKQTGGE